MITISQYACGSSDWLQYFGSNGEVDFTCDGYDDNSLQTHSGTINTINGKTLTCTDNGGNNYHLQVAPCTHFEGQYNMPRIGDTIYWKGSQSSCGTIYVLVATTCSC